ncbi:MAG TPA: amidohydrolase family protein [Vineibacter sp.]|nr:amidohydrolase family protein [Vineibacter sp.]
MKKLIRNAFVVSVDPTIGNIDGADILIDDGGRIAAIGRGIDAADAEIIDAEGHIASPGFVDTHHHIWQSIIRGITADWSLGDYLAGIRMFIARLYSPEDMYVAQLSGALQALHAGVTTTADYCHNLNSPDHVEESIRGAKDSGARIVWCYGFNQPPLSNPAFPDFRARADYLVRTARDHFADRNALVTLAVCPEESAFWPEIEAGRAQFEIARSLGVRQFWHANSTGDAVSGTPKIDAGRAISAGLLGPDTVLVHMNNTTPQEWRQVADCGCHVSITPETEMQMNMGWPAIGQTAAHGINASVGIDIVSNNSADLRFQLRLLLQAQRWAQTADKAGRLSSGVSLSATEALTWGTLNGARALGLDHAIGSLTPGKQADILLHDMRGITTAGWDRSQPEATLLLQCGIDTLATVLVAGKIVKSGGRLVADEAKVCRQAEAGNARIVDRIRDAGGLRRALDENLRRYIKPSDETGRALYSYSRARLA